MIDLAHTLTITPDTPFDATINGTAGDDVLNGSQLDEMMVGKGGDDALSGLGGDDLLLGGQGDDTLLGGGGDDTLNGASGLDSLDGGSGDDLVYASPDVFRAGDFGETLNGGSGSDTVSFLYCKEELDLFVSDLNGMNITHFENVTGSAFGDTIRGTQKHEVLDGGAGDDNLRGSGSLHDKSQSDTLMGGEGDDTLGGGKHGDLLQGGDGDDLIIANYGADTIEGGDGNDRISVGLDGAVITGGAGADDFNFFPTVNEGTSATALITDLEDQDFIDLHRIDADTTTGDDDAFVLVSAFDGHAGQAVLSYDSGTNTTLLLLDTGGDGAADITISLTGDHSDFSNFLL